MRHAPSTLHFSHAFRPAAPGAIEWEELPSFANTLTARLTRLGLRHAAAATITASAAPWDATRPAELDTRPVSPFREPLQGLSMRETEEPDVFRHFFGA